MADQTGIPSDRLSRAGATDEEIALLESQFRRSDLIAQESIEAFYRRSSEGDIREFLQDLREAGAFLPATLEEAPEPVETKKASAEAIVEDLDAEEPVAPEE